MAATAAGKESCATFFLPRFKTEPEAEAFTSGSVLGVSFFESVEPPPESSREPGRLTRAAEILRARAELTPDELIHCRSARSLYRLLQHKLLNASGVSRGLSFDAIRRAVEE
jgi:hypothetical protein